MYCRNCGRKLEEDSIFCSACGVKVEGRENQVGDVNSNSGVQTNQVEQETQSVQPNKPKKKKKRILLIILVILGILLFVLNRISKYIPKYYYGDGYTLEYSGDWSLVETTTWLKLLENDRYDLYFTPAGNNSLSDVTNSLRCNFNDANCQKRIYDMLYSSWDDGMKERDMIVSSGSNGFSLLKDDIYYAYFDYGKSSFNRNGRLFALVSIDEDIIISFMFEFRSGDIKGNDDAILSLLKTIDIDD